MGDAFKNRVAQELSQFITEHNLWEVVVLIAIVAMILFGAGAVLGFFYKRAQHYAELKKLSAELVTANLDAALKRQESRGKFTNVAELLALQLRSWREATISEPNGQLDAIREEALRLFDSEFIPRFVDYSEIQFASLPKLEKRRFAKEEVNAFLQTVSTFLSGVNYRPILTQLSREPFKLKKTTLRRICTEYKDAVPWWSLKDRDEFKKLCRSISLHERES
jgi:hypothetical protein